MLNLHLLECTLKDYDHISDLLLAKHWVITGCKYKGCNINTIVCCPRIPPKIDNSFGEFEILIVPTGCEEVYANSDWGKFL